MPYLLAERDANEAIGWAFRRLEGDDEAWGAFAASAWPEACLFFLDDAVARRVAGEAPPEGPVFTGVIAPLGQESGCRFVVAYRGGRRPLWLDLANARKEFAYHDPDCLGFLVCDSAPKQLTLGPTIPKSPVALEALLTRFARLAGERRAVAVLPDRECIAAVMGGLGFEEAGPGRRWDGSPGRSWCRG